MNSRSDKIYRWKGRIVTERVYNQRQAQSAAATKKAKAKTNEEIPDVQDAPYLQTDEEPNEEDKQTQQESSSNNSGENFDSLSSDVPNPGEGRRLVDLQILAHFLKCASCEVILSLEFIEKETRRGLASTLYVRCHDCLLVNEVPTGECLVDKDARTKIYPVNCKAVMGTLHAGMGCHHLNKLMACLNVPAVHPNIFKRYERIVGPAIETVAKNSCADAAILERTLTIQNADKIEKLL